MLAIVPRMPTVAATGLTTFSAPLFGMGEDTTVPGTSLVMLTRRARGVMGPGRSHQRGKGSGIGALLGMPLHPEDERGARELHRLDDPVVGERRRGQPGPEPIDRLVVAAQDCDAGPEYRRRRGIGRRRHLHLAEH